jgi:pyruvate,water dikinase
MAQWNNYDAFGVLPKDTNTNLGGHQPEIPVDDDKPYRGIRGWKKIGRAVKVLLAVEGAKRKAHSSFAHVQDLTKALMEKDFRGLDDRELLIEYSDIVKIFMDFAPKFGLLACASGNIMFLIKELEKDFPGKGNALATAIMAGSAEITSAAQGYRLVELAEMARQDSGTRGFFAAEPFNPLSWEEELSANSPFKQSFREFLSEYGHRGIYEVEIMNPRWREDPSYLLDVIRNTINTADLDKIRVRQKDTSEYAWREIKRKLPLHRRLLVNFLVRQSGKGAEMREMSKSIYVMSLEPLRKILLETGSRFKERGIIKERSDVFHSAWHELLSILRGDWNGNELKTLIEERKARRTEFEKLSPPDLFIGDTPQSFVKYPHCSGKALSGLGVAAGRGDGPVRIVRHPGEGIKLVQGDILVAPSTDPAWTPLFLRASAIVMETGGHLSHGAIVAREYGIPAVVNIPGVLQILSDGQQITVDGDVGKIFLS